MRDKTREYKAESYKDFQSIRTKNNAKDEKRSPEQREQALRDKRAYYSSKWSRMLSEAETKAQKRIAENMVYFIAVYTK